MVKWSIAADSHFKASEPLGRMDMAKGMNTRTLAKLASLDAFLAKSLELNVDFAVYAGDLFNNDNPPPWLRKAVSQVFSKYSSELAIVFIAGNHDHSGQVGAFESEGILAENSTLYDCSPGFYYINETKNVCIAGIDFVFAPYHDIKSIESVCTGYDEEDNPIPMPSVLISHFYVSGASISKSNTPHILKGEGIDATFLREFSLIQLGDIHNPQVIDNGKGGIWYPGLLSRVQIDDDAIQPGFLLTTCEPSHDGIKNIEVTRIEIPDWNIQRIIVTQEDCSDTGAIPDAIIGSLSNPLPEIVHIDFKGEVGWLQAINYYAIRKRVYELGIMRLDWDTVRKRADKDKETVTTQVAGSLVDRWAVYAHANSVDDSVIQLATKHLGD